MRQGERTDLQPSANLQKERAAELLNVNVRSVGHASEVREKGASELTHFPLRFGYTRHGAGGWRILAV